MALVVGRHVYIKLPLPAAKGHNRPELRAKPQAARQATGTLTKTTMSVGTLAYNTHTAHWQQSACEVPAQGKQSIALRFHIIANAEANYSHSLAAMQEQQQVMNDYRPSPST